MTWVACSRVIEKKVCSHGDDEIHGRVIVVEQQDLEHRRRFDSALLGLQQSAVAVSTRPRRCGIH